MKIKRFDKKLVLNKKTVVHLDSGELNAANGGNTILLTDITCTTCTPTCFTCVGETCITGFPCQACV